MKPMGQIIKQVSASLASPPPLERGVTAKRVDPDNLPRAFVREVDIDLPRRLWSSWIPGDGSPRAIHRELTVDERTALQKRMADLEPALAPYSPEDEDRVAESVSDMFGAFPAMRAQGADAIGKVDSVMRLLRPFPFWAIRQACERIRMKGYEIIDRDGARMEKHWPPADVEVVSEIEQAIRLRSDALATAIALLSAPIEGQERKGTAA